MVRLFRSSRRGSRSNASQQANNNNNNMASSTAAVGSSNTNDDLFLQQSQELIPAEVRMISGCHSEQTSADVSNVVAANRLPNPAGRAGGACTSALLDILYSTKSILSFQDLLLQLRQALSEKGFSQVPQLTSSRPLECKSTPFQLVSNLNGTRRALLVGINYRGQDGQLSGCHNDVFNMKQYIVKMHDFPEDSITVLVDDGRHLYPTRQKIIAALQQLVAQSQAGDSVYFHYSGHGGLLMPAQGNAFKINNHHHDETLYPLDHARSGQIRDFSLFHHFVKPMAAGVMVTCVMDCCHSGAVLDLPYSFRPTDSGTIMRRENMSSLSNLAFLYILAGGILPHALFGNVQNHLQGVVDGDLNDYQGAGMDGEVENDLMSDGYPDNDDIPTDDYDAGYDGGGGEDYYYDRDGDEYGASEMQTPENGYNTEAPEYGDAVAADDPVVVQGMPADVEDFAGYGDAMVVPGVPADDGGGDYGLADGVVVPGVAVPDDGGGYGDNYEYGGYEYSDAGGAVDGADDADCGCVNDILGSFLDGGDF